MIRALLLFMALSGCVRSYEQSQVDETQSAVIAKLADELLKVRRQCQSAEVHSKRK